MMRGDFINMTEEALRSFATDHNTEDLVNKMVDYYLSYLYRQKELINVRIEDENRRDYKNDSLVEEIRLIEKTIEGLENANIGELT